MMNLCIKELYDRVSSLEDELKIIRLLVIFNKIFNITKLVSCFYNEFVFSHVIIKMAVKYSCFNCKHAL